MVFFFYIKHKTISCFFLSADGANSDARLSTAPHGDVLGDILLHLHPLLARLLPALAASQAPLAPPVLQNRLRTVFRHH